ncbi:MAG: hypothetical protein GXO75_02435 [Calditrichaeota bacterium]|nr:hypothetical protein [Calditrichota bacterium]
MKKYDFQLENGDKNVGTVYLPDFSDRELPVVIYCHGWRATRRLFPSAQMLCTSLLTQPAAMVTFDFFGCGDTGGSPGEMSYGRWVSNLRYVFDWVAKQDWSDNKKIGCFSISSGTTVALRFAETSNDLAFVVSVATCLSVHMNMPNGPGKVFIDNFDSLVNGGTADVFRVPLDIHFFKDFIGKAPIHNLQSITCPVFFLQGSADNIYRRTDAWIGHEVMQKNNLSSKYLEMPDGNHGLDNVSEQCAGEIIEWLREIHVLSVNRE